MKSLEAHHWNILHMLYFNNFQVGTHWKRGIYITHLIYRDMRMH